MMGSVTKYRDGTPADAAAVDALFRRSFVATFGHLYAADDLALFLGGFTAEAWRGELGDQAMAFQVAEDEGALVGYAKIGPIALPVSPAGPAVELRQLYVDEAAKGTGVGATLLDWTIAEARARGAGELFLSVYVDNHRAKAFYARRGFVDVGRYDFTVGNHHDEDRLMRLVL